MFVDLIFFVIFIDRPASPMVNRHRYFSNFTPAHRNARAEPEQSCSGRSLCPRCKSGQPGRARAPAGVVCSYSCPAQPHSAGVGSRRRWRPLSSGAVMVLQRPDLPLGSAQALAASVRGAFGNAIAWMCLRRGIGPGHPDWPELSRAIVAFGGSVKRFRAGLPACGLQWWENPDIIPGMIGEAVATPAATATAVLLSRLDVVDVPPPALIVAAAEVGHAVSTAPVRPVLARVTTGPPTGPPSRRDDQICYA